MNPDDHELLRRYAKEGSEEAFAELTRRRLDLAWGAAMRITGDADIAKDVAQKTFCDLARKARFMPTTVILAGWIYRAACLEARRTVRDATRRAERERNAMKLHATPSTDAELERDTARLLPQLDTALCALSQKDRDAVVLRFLEKKSLAHVGDALGMSEDAAQKRVSRALYKLRSKLTVGTGVLASTLAVAGSQAAPAGLAASVTVGSAGIIGGPAALIFYLKTQIACMKTQLLVGTLVTAAIATPLTVQQQTLNDLRQKNVQLSEIADRATALQTENAALAKRDLLAQELARLEENHAEILALREEFAAYESAEHTRKTQLKEQSQRLELEAARISEEAEFLANAREGRRTSERQQQIGSLTKSIVFFAFENRDRYPDRLDDIESTMIEKGYDEVNFEEYELFEGIRGASLQDLTGYEILVREKEPRPIKDRKWIRVYGFAHGSSAWTSDSQNFEKQEDTLMAEPEQGLFARLDEVMGITDRIMEIRAGAERENNRISLLKALHDQERHP